MLLKSSIITSDLVVTDFNTGIKKLVNYLK